MGLSSSLQIGNSALTAAQLAIQVTGNNLANAATPGYSRQIAYLSPSRSTIDGRFSVGTGVGISDIRRQIDQALQARLNTSVSQEAAAGQVQSTLSGIESALGELGDHSLSNQLSSFFNSWSERANNTQSSAVVVQQGQALADFVKNLRSSLLDQKNQNGAQLGAMVQKADGLLSQIAGLNQAVSDAEAGGRHADSLRDQRDTVITQLSQYMDVSAVEQPGGSVNILVGSTPVVLGSHSRGLKIVHQPQGSADSITVNINDDNQRLAVQSGQIGAVLSGAGDDINGALSKLDTLTGQLIFEVNKLHSTGSTAAGLSTSTGSVSMGPAERSRALDDPFNTAFAGLPYKAVSGGFTIQVKSPTGSVQSVRINVDLDGRTSTGAPGTSDDTSAEDIRAALANVPGVSASFTGDGRLKIDAAAGYSYSFSDDSSGALALLGVNSFFTGSGPADISVRQDLKDSPSLLATGRMVNGSFVENGNALAIAGIQDQSLAALGGQSIKASWTDTAQSIGVRTGAAKSSAEAASTVRQNLDAQRASISGVSVDEESVNLLTYQRQYQGAAKFISVVDEMTQTLISLV